jgi:hypothetical protein
MRKTAVEWLFTLMVEPNYPIAEQKKWLEQALQMEKEQIIHAHLTGLMHPLEMEATKQAEQYYNETYGGKQ